MTKIIILLQFDTNTHYLVVRIKPSDSFLRFYSFLHRLVVLKQHTDDMVIKRPVF